MNDRRPRVYADRAPHPPTTRSDLSPLSTVLSSGLTLTGMLLMDLPGGQSRLILPWLPLNNSNLIHTLALTCIDAHQPEDQPQETWVSAQR